MPTTQTIEPLLATREIDPEQLLKTLEIQLLVAQRRPRGHGGRRTAFRVGSLAFMVFALLLALLAMQWLAAERPRRSSPPTTKSVAP